MLAFLAKFWANIVALLTRVALRLVSIFCLLFSIYPFDISHPSSYSHPTPTFITHLHPATSFNRPTLPSFSRDFSPSTALPQPSDGVPSFTEAIKQVTYKIRHMHMLYQSYALPSHEEPIQVRLTITKITGLNPALPTPADIIGHPSSALVQHEHITQILVAGLFVSLAAALGCVRGLTPT
ncbi:hypothetical protein RSAG8_13592, partial [Rhizoctonia solani AG-8 WAC10335]